jgi:predicted acetyltransferase
MTGPMVRPIAEDEFALSIDVVRTAFLSPPASPEAVAARRAHYDIERCLGAFDAAGRLCGVARAFATTLTVPGGEVAAGGVSAVGVLPTHRRQGHLGRMMRTQLADIAARGEPVAVLVAAEYPIYARFGYGPATEATTLHLDAHGARWREDAGGSVEIVDNETFAKLIDQLYDRTRRANAGHLARDTWLWEAEAGVLDFHSGEDQARREATKVVWRDEAGEVQATAGYRIDESWVHNRPANTLTSEILVASSARAGQEMLRFLASVDWVSEVRVWLRPVDDPVPLALVDARVARLEDRSDHTWLRILDVPAALGARRYATGGSLVIEVQDDLGFASGRFRLDAGPDGADCVATTADPDLVAPASALGAAYLGGQSWTRLADAGWVDERRAGAVEEATALFAVPRAPWGAFTF